MTTTTEPRPTVQLVDDSAIGRLVRALRTDPLAAVGLALVVIVVVLAVAGPLIAPYPDQGAGQTNAPEQLQPPSAAHWLGTDPVGRDVLSRIIMGANPALSISLSVVAAAALIGIPIGAIAGYRGGWLDAMLMRVTEVFQAFPPLLLAMVTVALLGPSLLHAGIALAISWWPWYARLVRTEAASLRDRPFVESARAIGVPAWRIVLRHVLRNCMTPVIVQATVDVGAVVLAAGSLAFIGLGAQQPTPDWGLMVAEGRGLVFSSWWVSAFPGIAIFVTVLGCNLLGDALRDVLDPRRVQR